MNAISAGPIVPGGVYLCQANKTVSCGACCGLYNLNHISRQTLESILRRRTGEFASIPRTLEAMDAFSKAENQRLGESKPYPEFHHCPFVGLIGADRTRVGCLLHPWAAGNDNVDYRGISYYGGMACRDYFCSATRTLASFIKELLRNLKTDWYVYGLVVTEAKLHQALFQKIKKLNPRLLNSTESHNDPKLVQWFHELLTLKITWPYRNPQKSACHYLFEDGIYTRPAINYGKLNVSVSRYDTILRELDSHFESKETLASAESHLDRLLTFS